MQENMSNTIGQDEKTVKLCADSHTEASVTVLLVEDEHKVREVVREILALKGYHVLEAADAPEALHQCERHQGSIHLLLTDVQMPGMNGCRLAELVGAARNETRVLLMSGYADDALLRYGIETLGAAFIQKPFLPNSLLNAVQAALEAGAAASASGGAPAGQAA
jgi:CheY-like chemotaxis protein